MSKQHLDGFAMAARSFESLGLGQGTSNVASILIHIAHDPARRHIWTAFWFEHAGSQTATPSNGAHDRGRFDIHDDAHLDVHQIIVRISEESWPSHRAGLLRG